MKKNVFIVWMVAPVLIFTACKKEISDDFTTYVNHPLNDTIWVRNLPGTAPINDLFDLLLPKAYIDSFDATNGSILKYGDSLEIDIKGGSCTGPGSTGPVQGTARIELISLKRKGDFIKVFKPTTTANGSLLETGGGLFIRILKDNRELTLTANSTIRIKFSDIDTAKPNMQAFYGREGIPPPLRGIDTAFSWVRDFDTSYLPTWSKPSNNPLAPSYFGYELNSKNLRWVTADRYIDSTQPKTKVTAILSPNYTNKNTAVFAVFNNRKTVVNMKGDYASRSFFATNIPLRTSVKLVSLSKIGSDLYLGVKEISSVATVTSYTIVPAKKSLSEILAYLNSL